MPQYPTGTGKHMYIIYLFMSFAAACVTSTTSTKEGSKIQIVIMAAIAPESLFLSLQNNIQLKAQKGVKIALLSLPFASTYATGCFRDARAFAAADFTQRTSASRTDVLKQSRSGLLPKKAETVCFPRNTIRLGAYPWDIFI